MNKKYILLFSTVTFAAVTGAYGILNLNSGQRSAQELVHWFMHDVIYFTHDPSIHYRELKVDSGPVVSTISASGSLAAVATVQVGSQISGQIIELLADFNKEVRKGEALAIIDPVPFENAVEIAAGDLDIARATVETQRAVVKKAKADLEIATANSASAAAQAQRYETVMNEAGQELRRKNLLASTGNVSSALREQTASLYEGSLSQLQAAEADAKAKLAGVQAAEAALQAVQSQVDSALGLVKLKIGAWRQAMTDLDRTKVRAPIDGTVIARTVEEGQTVAASLEAPTLFTIAQNLAEMQINISVDEADIGRIRPGQAAVFTVDSFPEQTFYGQVTQVRKYAQTQQNVVTYTVVASAPNPDKVLLPGMTANVRIILAQRDKVVRVPNAALRFRPPGKTGPDQPHVWVSDADGPRPVSVRLGLSDDAFTEIVWSPEALTKVIIGANVEAPKSAVRKVLGSV